LGKRGIFLHQGANSNMPIGLNVVGPEFSDLQTIDFARLLKTECGFGFTPPPMAATAASGAAAAAAPKL
jgi:Asp-tRNA(Asn)/Glu-tRNA(Gln) amidotransferase A subunit family amidase